MGRFFALQLFVNVLLENIRNQDQTTSCSKVYNLFPFTFRPRFMKRISIIASPLIFGHFPTSQCYSLPVSQREKKSFMRKGGTFPARTMNKFHVNVGICNMYCRSPFYYIFKNLMTACSFVNHCFYSIEY